MMSLDNETEEPIWVEVFEYNEALPAIYDFHRKTPTSEYKPIWYYGCVFPQTTLRLLSPHQLLKFEWPLDMGRDGHKIEAAYLDDPKVAKLRTNGRELSKREAKRVYIAWKMASYEFVAPPAETR
jgi:hypothetical protein